MVTRNLKNTYWYDGKGKYQQFVNDKLDNGGIDNLNINKTLKDEYKKMAHSYYRFYNDGDIPRHQIFKGKNEDEISILLEYKINEIIEKIIKAENKEI